uniref:Uncharacterized protein n=1 Tax=Lygus hesperus TaxID=30085 RepID=A0A146LYV5_LYGHE
MRCTQHRNTTGVHISLTIWNKEMIETQPLFEVFISIKSLFAQQIVRTSHRVVLVNQLCGIAIDNILCNPTVWQHKVILNNLEVALVKSSPHNCTILKDEQVKPTTYIDNT